MKRLDEGGKAAPKAKHQTVRFNAVVEAAGQPEVYLPLFDPKHDKTFMRAVNENRVLSIRQEPTSQRTDFGTVGFDDRKFTTLLIFPKPLTSFADSRVVGIKYDLVGESRIVSSTGPRPSKLSKPKNVRRSEPMSPFRHLKERKRPAPKQSSREPPKRVEPKPRKFRVRVRITTVTEKDVDVRALTKTEAKQKAQAETRNEGQVRVVEVSQG